MIKKKVSTVQYVYKVKATGVEKEWSGNPEHPMAKEIADNIWNGVYILLECKAVSSKSDTRSSRSND